LSRYSCSSTVKSTMYLWAIGVPPPGSIGRQETPFKIIASDH
jgi:hypothetical protein